PGQPAPGAIPWPNTPPPRAGATPPFNQPQWQWWYPFGVSDSLVVISGQMNTTPPGQNKPCLVAWTWNINAHTWTPQTDVSDRTRQLAQSQAPPDTHCVTDASNSSREVLHAYYVGSYPNGQWRYVFGTGATVYESSGLGADGLLSWHKQVDSPLNYDPVTERGGIIHDDIQDYFVAGDGTTEWVVSDGGVDENLGGINSPFWRMRKAG